MDCGTNASPSATKNADGPLRGAGASVARSSVVIATDDSGVGPLRIRQPAFDVAVHRVGDVLEFGVLVDVGRNHLADRDDAQACVAGGLQRLTDENRCQTTAFECIVHLGVGENALAVAIPEL